MASVADLVEPALRERAGEYLVRAGDVLRADGRVALVEFGPLRVTATVMDDGVGHVTELTSTSAGLVVRCDCPGGIGGELCPHTVAVAIETWERAPQRRG
jgi:uncharacterized Zn finger protein